MKEISWLIYSIVLLYVCAKRVEMCTKVSGFKANSSCHEADWWTSFEKRGWSKCSNSSYINGLYRNTASSEQGDWIFLLEKASCCNNGTFTAECVKVDWRISFKRNFNWNRCPSGHYLSGLYRSDGERATLSDIEYGWCCKPNGAPSYLKMCYDEDVSSSFHWDKKGMVSCSRSGYYITALYRSTCRHLHCITKFRCCEFQVAEVNSSCHEADWWRSFGKRGWSKCSDSSYINGLYRNVANSGQGDWIFLLEKASCCNNGTLAAECVEVDWRLSFERNFDWNRCPSGHYLSGLYRSDGERATLNDIEYGWCCKPNGAPSYFKMCYDEDVSSSFHWDKKGMVSCSRSGYYISALYRSRCPHLHCITKFRCCEFQVAEVNSSCHNANWWASFDYEGWSKCPGTSPYINGFLRSDVMFDLQDWLYNLDEATCCKNGTSDVQCVQANWMISFDRKLNWNSCPTGYYLSGLYRSESNTGLLTHIEYAWCCKPSGAPEAYTSCYDEDVSISFNWNQSGMASCRRSDHYITALFKSDCDFLHCIKQFRCCKFQDAEASPLCQNANWWSSFSAAGWSKCPKQSPYIKGLYRKTVSQASDDSIDLLKDANCCNNGTLGAECVQTNWNMSINREFKWSTCPSGYYLSGFYRSNGNKLYDITHAWCCKPSGAPESYKTCYDEDVLIKFDWHQMEMVSCDRSGYYITGLYKSDCNQLHCIERFRCCELQIADPCPSLGVMKLIKVNAVPSNRSVKFTWTYDADDEDTGFHVSISGGHPAKKLNISMREFTYRGLEPNKTYYYHYTILYGKGCMTVPATDFFTTLPDFSDTDKPYRKSEEKRLNTGALVGGIFGGILILIIIVVIVLRKRILKRRHEESVREFHRLHRIDNPTTNLCNNQLLIPPPPEHNSKREESEDEPEELSYIVLLENWDILPENLTLLDKKLGGGQFGIVKQGLLTTGKGDPEIVAVKTVKDNAKESDVQDLITELTILKEVNRKPHPNVMRLIGGCSIEGKLHVIMEFCLGGNLRQFLINSRVNTSEENLTKYVNLKSTLSHHQLLKIAVDIANGMVHLSSQKLVHRDLAARNILLAEDNTAKVSDFGLARDIGGAEEYIRNNQNLLPVKWMALESLLHGRFTTASDVWSYGILLHEITTLGEEPYKNISSYNIVAHVGCGCRLRKPPECSDELYEIMTKCWKVEAKERPTFEEIQESLNNMLNDGEKSYINVTKIVTGR